MGKIMKLMTLLDRENRRRRLTPGPEPSESQRGHHRLRDFQDDLPSRPDHRGRDVDHHSPHRRGVTGARQHLDQHILLKGLREEGNEHAVVKRGIGRNPLEGESLQKLSAHDAGVHPILLLEDLQSKSAQAISSIMKASYRLGGRLLSSDGQDGDVVVIKTYGQEFEISFVNVPMSGLSKYILRRLDIGDIVEKRRLNCQHVSKSLETVTSIVPFFPKPPTD